MSLILIIINHINIKYLLATATERLVLSSGWLGVYVQSSVPDNTDRSRSGA